MHQDSQGNRKLKDSYEINPTCKSPYFSLFINISRRTDVHSSARSKAAEKVSLPRDILTHIQLLIKAIIDMSVSILVVINPILDQVD